MSLEEAERLKAMIAARPEAASLAERREGFEAMAARMPVPDGTQAREAELGGVPGRWVAAPGATGAHAMLWLHGGAFVLGSSKSYAAFCARLSAASGARVFCPDYRLAPEHPFPAALDDAEAAWRALAAGDDETLWLGGDSCGGNLAVAALHRQAKRGGRMPDAFYLVSPYLDLTHTGESIGERGHRDVFVRPEAMDATARIYLGGADPADEGASPLFGDVAGFPRTLIQVGGDESLYSDAERMAGKLRDDGIDAELHEAPGMMHVYPFFAPWLQEGADAVEHAGRWLRG